MSLLLEMLPRDGVGCWREWTRGCDEMMGVHIRSFGKIMYESIRTVAGEFLFWVWIWEVQLLCDFLFPAIDQHYTVDPHNSDAIMWISISPYNS